MKKHLLTGVGILVVGAGLHFASLDTPVSDLVSRLKQEEGFRPKPYRDSRGILTIGYGTNIQAGITRVEGEWLLRERLITHEKELASAWPSYYAMPDNIKAALLDMTYQLGVHGVLEFHHMLEALIQENYSGAIEAAKDSDWARETPVRVERVVKIFREVSDGK